MAYIEMAGLWKGSGPGKTVRVFSQKQASGSSMGVAIRGVSAAAGFSSAGKKRGNRFPRENVGGKDL